MPCTSAVRIHRVEAAERGSATSNGPPRWRGPLRNPETYPIYVAVHLDGVPTAFVPRLRSVMQEVDPTVRTYRPRSMDQVTRDTLVAYEAWSGWR